MCEIKFENGSTIKALPSGNQNTRGERSNFYETLCLDTECEDGNVYVIARIDMREPIGRYVPVWMLEDRKHVQKLHDYLKYYRENPVKHIEETLGIKLHWYQKVYLNSVCKVKEWFKILR